MRAEEKMDMLHQIWMKLVSSDKGVRGLNEFNDNAEDLGFMLWCVTNELWRRPEDVDGDDWGFNGAECDHDENEETFEAWTMDNCTTTFPGREQAGADVIMKYEKAQRCFFALRALSHMHARSRDRATVEQTMLKRWKRLLAYIDELDEMLEYFWNKELLRAHWVFIRVKALLVDMLKLVQDKHPRVVPTLCDDIIRMGMLCEHTWLRDGVFQRIQPRGLKTV